MNLCFEIHPTALNHPQIPNTNCNDNLGNPRPDDSLSVGCIRPNKIKQSQVK